MFPVADMSSRVEAREDTEDLQVWLDGDHMLDDAQDGGDGTTAAAIDPCWRSNMLIQILLKAGQASPTHTFVYLDRCVRGCTVALSPFHADFLLATGASFFCVSKPHEC